MWIPGASLAVVGAIATAVLFPACGNTEDRPQLIVGAASSLEPLFREISERFMEAHDVEVVLVFSATGTLAHQIEQGAPIDVFASADTTFMDLLDSQGIVERSTIRTFGLGRLEFVATRQPSGDHAMVAQLTDARLIAIANPEIAPYGAAARRLLDLNGVWDEIGSRVVYTQNAAQVLQLLQSGDVDFGFVPASLVFGRKVQGVVFPRDPDYAAQSDSTLKQTVAVVSASTEQVMAQRFIDTLTSPDTGDVLARYGYEPYGLPTDIEEN
jgi:molybdate transport system substrate-binding protein